MCKRVSWIMRGSGDKNMQYRCVGVLIDCALVMADLPERLPTQPNPQPLCATLQHHRTHLWSLLYVSYILTVLTYISRPHDCVGQLGHIPLDRLTGPGRLHTSPATGGTSVVHSVQLVGTGNDLHTFYPDHRRLEWNQRQR
jgi:hypothetical protein